MKEKPVRPVTAKGASTRERILDGARTVLIEKGFDAFVMRELAETLGIKLGNLQYYFRTKEALVCAVIEREAALDVLAIERCQAAHASADAAFRAVVVQLLNRWRSSSGVLFATLTALSLHSTAFSAVYEQVYARFYLALEGLVQAMNPTLSAAEVALRVRLITALIDGSSLQPQVGGRARYLARVKQQAERIVLE